METTGYVRGAKPDNVFIPVLGGAERPRAGAVHGYSLRTKPSPNFRSVCKREAAFSLTELVVALAIALILAGIGLPSFLRAYHTYQLTNAAQQVADILRLTRYEAIRLNTQVNCLIQTSTSDSTMTNVWADSNRNNAIDPGEKTVLLQSFGNLVSAGAVSGASALPAAANLGVTPVNPSSTNGSVSFDARGAVIPTGTVSVLYLANTNIPDPGYRAVILLPAGSIQIWTSDGSGNWQQLR
ncbi:MAG TPA: GspH/FimT family pseudopilin [Candidatus Acidoferrum sp.]